MQYLQFQLPEGVQTTSLFVLFDMHAVQLHAGVSVIVERADNHPGAVDF